MESTVKCPGCGGERDRFQIRCGCEAIIASVIDDADIEPFLRDLAGDASLQSTVPDVRAVMATLYSKERKFLVLYYGWDGLGRLSDGEIAKAYQGTPGWVRDIRRQTFQRMKYRNRMGILRGKEYLEQQQRFGEEHLRQRKVVFAQQPRDEECPHCQWPVGSKDNYCANCGKSLRAWRKQKKLVTSAE